MHRVACSVDDIDEALETAARHGCHPLRGVASYGDVYKLTYVRGPSGILVMLAEEVSKSRPRVDHPRPPAPARHPPTRSASAGREGRRAWAGGCSRHPEAVDLQRAALRAVPSTAR